jgi:hypothetical protein
VIAGALLGRYKDPQLRVLALDLVCADPDLILETFRLELGDRIRLIRTVEGGYIDRQLFVQKIDVAGAPQGVWTVRLGVTDAAFVFQPVTDQFDDFDELQAAFDDFDSLSLTEH